MLKAKGLQEASKLVDAQWKPTSPSTRTEDDIDDGNARHIHEVSVSSSDTHKEDQIKVSRNSREINNETKRGMDNSPLNSKLNNINNNTRKIERNKTEPGDYLGTYDTQ